MPAIAYTNSVVSVCVCGGGGGGGSTNDAHAHIRVGINKNTICMDDMWLQSTEIPLTLLILQLYWVHPCLLIAQLIGCMDKQWLANRQLAMQHALI